MMHSWKQKATVPEAQAVAVLGQHFIDLWNENIGFGPEDVEPMLATNKLRSEPPGNPTAAGRESLLRLNGPLWVTTLEPRAAGNHARVMLGISGDGSPELTFVDLIDPATGKRNKAVQYATFAADFEREARLLTQRPDLLLRIQIYHW